MRPPSQRSGNETRGHAARRGQLSGWREARGFTAIEGPVSVPTPSLYDAQLWGEPSWGLLVPDRESFSLEGPRKCLKVHTGAQETTAGGRGWQPLGQERCPSRASGAPLDREQVLAAGHVPCAGSQRHPVCLPWRVLLRGTASSALEGDLGYEHPSCPPIAASFPGRKLIFRRGGWFQAFTPWKSCWRVAPSRAPGHPSRNSSPRLRAKQIRSGIILIERINTWG